MPHVFNEVWYFPRAKRWYDLNLLAFYDTGVLTVLDDALEFRGNKGTVLISHIRRVSYGKYGRDFINHWVRWSMVLALAPPLHCSQTGAYWDGAV